jgi:hypothetical protein
MRCALARAIWQREPPPGLVGNASPCGLAAAGAQRILRSAQDDMRELEKDDMRELEKDDMRELAKDDMREMAKDDIHG